jgi:hypothetical protein
MAYQARHISLLPPLIIIKKHDQTAHVMDCVYRSKERDQQKRGVVLTLAHALHERGSTGPNSLEFQRETGLSCFHLFGLHPASCVGRSHRPPRRRRRWLAGRHVCRVLSHKRLIRPEQTLRFGELSIISTCHGGTLSVVYLGSLKPNTRSVSQVPKCRAETLDLVRSRKAYFWKLEAYKRREGLVNGLFWASWQTSTRCRAVTGRGQPTTPIPTSACIQGHTTSTAH